MKEKENLYRWGGVYKCPKCRQVTDWYIESDDNKGKLLGKWFVKEDKTRTFRCGGCRFEEKVSLNMANHLVTEVEKLPHLRKLKGIWGTIKSDLIHQLYLSINKGEFDYSDFIDEMVKKYKDELPNYTEKEIKYACKKYLECYYSVDL